MFRVEQKGDVTRIHIERSEARNAIPIGAWSDLAGLVGGLTGSANKLVVIQGSSEAFCAGADLGEFPKLQRDEAARLRFRQDMRSAMEAIGGLEMPVVAWIEGPCYGAGVALAMACDLRAASSSASFAITPAKIGISYPQEDVHRLVELVGTGKAARLLYSALSVDAEEAHRIGLVDVLAEEIEPLVAAISANESESLRLLKRSLQMASQGCRQSDSLDGEFDRLLCGEALGRRLEALGRA